jgi:hypothetical protein
MMDKGCGRGLVCGKGRCDVCVWVVMIWNTPNVTTKQNVAFVLYIVGAGIGSRCHV